MEKPAKDIPIVQAGRGTIVVDLWFGIVPLLLSRGREYRNFEAITNYFLNRLPKDFVSYWDLIFMDGSEQSRDTSATAIAVCGMSLMDAFLPETNSHKLVYKCAQHSMLRSLSENYTESKTDGITALLNEGVYSWHSGKGVNEGNIWGDYFYLEALVRFKKLENVLVKQEERKCKTQCKNGACR